MPWRAWLRSAAARAASGRTSPTISGTRGSDPAMRSVAFVVRIHGVLEPAVVRTLRVDLPFEDLLCRPLDGIGFHRADGHDLQGTDGRATGERCRRNQRQRKGAP